MMRAAMQRAMYQRSPMQKAIDRIGAPLWTPARLFAASEQGVWYDPSDFSTLFQDSAGTVPVTATGQVVGKMLDKSGRGNHATQATTASKPILQQDANGKYYLAFDGVDDGMATAAVNFTATDKMTVFAGLRNSTPNPFASIVELSPTTNTNSGAFALYGSISASGRFAAGQNSAGSYAYGEAPLVGSYPDESVITSLHDGATGVNATAIALRINSAVQTLSFTGTVGIGSFGNYPIYIGRRGGSELPFSGRIYQLIVRGALTDAAGITAAETFVNTKTAAYG